MTDKRRKIKNRPSSVFDRQYSITPSLHHSTTPSLHGFSGNQDDASGVKLKLVHAAGILHFYIQLHIFSGLKIDHLII